MKKKIVKKSLDDLIIVTDWLLAKDDKKLKLNDETNNTLRYKPYSYCLRYPKIIFYLNKYMNDLYSNCDTYLFLDTFKIIFKKFNITEKNQLLFSKFKPPKRQHFKNIIHSYFLNIRDKNISNSELNDLHRLYTSSIIDEEIVDNINSSLNGKEKSKNAPLEYKKEETHQFEPVLKFNNNILKYKSSRIICKNCALYNSPCHPVVSNLKNQNTDLDVIIVSEYPSSADFLSDNLISYIPKLLEKYNLNYIGTNLILCSPSNDEVPNEQKTIENCKGVTEHVYNTFKSHFKILVGAKVKNKFNIKGSMTKLNGTFTNDTFIITSTNNSALFKQGLSKLNLFLEKYASTKINRSNTESKVSPNIADISSELKNYTLFDVKIIGEKVLYVLIENETGNKKYISEDISIPIYIKRGSFEQCEYMTDQVNYTAYLSNSNRQQLFKLINENLNREIVA